MIVVWMGHDDNATTGLTGTTGALQAWTRLMASISTRSPSALRAERNSRRSCIVPGGYDVCCPFSRASLEPPAHVEEDVGRAPLRENGPHR